MLVVSLAAGCARLGDNRGREDSIQAEPPQGGAIRPLPNYRAPNDTGPLSVIPDGVIKPLPNDPPPIDTGPLSVIPDAVYFDFQVEKQAVLLPGSVRPRYPDVHELGLHGTVVAEFVVDTAGRVVPASLRLLRRSDPRLNQSVVEAVPSMRFTPAELHGHRVKERVEQPFVFRPSPSPSLAH